jgi:hypothetical protein
MGRGRKIFRDESMTKIEELEKKVEGLSPAELSLFREWFATFDAELWDRQLESDVAEGKLDLKHRAAPK